jgi:tight adherence protein B
MIIAASVLIGLAIIAMALSLYSISRRGQGEQIERRLADVRGQNVDGLDVTIFRRHGLSSIGILSKILSRLHLANHIDTMLKRAGLTMNVGTFALLTMVAFGLAWVLARATLHHTLLALGIGAAGAVIPYIIVTVKMNRRMALFSEQFPDAIDMIVNSLRAGFALNGAIQMVAEESPEPVASEFRILFEEQKLGLDIRQALVNFSDRMNTTDVPIFVTAVLIQRDTGGNLAEVLENIAYVIRDRYRILGEVRTFTAQGRLSGFILALLPIFMAGILSILSPGYIEGMVQDQLGSVLISVAVVLQVVGFLWIQKIVNIKI